MCKSGPDHPLTLALAATQMSQSLIIMPYQLRESKNIQYEFEFPQTQNPAGEIKLKLKAAGLGCQLYQAGVGFWAGLRLLLRSMLFWTLPGVCAAYKSVEWNVECRGTWNWLAGLKPPVAGTSLGGPDPFLPNCRAH
jgi:hypothetical protein